MRRLLVPLLFAILVVVAFTWGYIWRVGPEAIFPRWGLEIWSALGVALFSIGAYIFYKLSSRAIGKALLRAGGTEGDVKMILGLWKFVIVFIAILIILSLFFEFGAITAIVGAFGGMFLGWSLQAPVSGFAAWLLITIKRPFRVGDRVLLPTYGLVGDVLDVGPMYTVLNQVGGAVGSEEPVGRHILIPNAMLFSNLIINYTPRWAEGLPPPISPVKRDDKASNYILDEIVVRITFNSDWDTAEKILLDAAREVTADIIKATGQEPYIRSDLPDYYGIWMRLRYMTLATDRPRITHEIVKRICKEFAKNDNVDFAIPVMTAYSYKRAPAQPFIVRLENPSPAERCPQCGAENLQGSVYCRLCGVRMAGLKAGD